MRGTIGIALRRKFKAWTKSFKPNQSSIFKEAKNTCGYKSNEGKSSSEGPSFDFTTYTYQDTTAAASVDQHIGDHDTDDLSQVDLKKSL